jgi:glutamine amidotransferase
MTALAILDLGYGNTRSVALAFERIGLQPCLTNNPAIAESAERLVVPGVGAAAPAMARLNAIGLADVLRRRTRPTLGICLGMQMLFDRSAEAIGVSLLGLISGEVTPLTPAPRFPVPHMGWSRLTCRDEAAGVAEGDYVYFAHGFRCPDSKFTTAHALYGTTNVPAVIRRGHLWGAQFHPERSSDAGARFLRAFAAS